MILGVLALAAGATGALDTKCTLSKAFVEGQPYFVHIDVRNSGKASESLETWMLEAGGFELDGKPIGKRDGKEGLQIGPGGHLTLDLDISAALGEALEKNHKPFKLSWGGESQDVGYYEPAPKGLDFLKMPPADLSKYFVQMQTSRGAMFVEFWPDVAPEHVRNFLDLSYTGFYDGTLFHRVGPGFMIQGGDPNTKSNSQQTWGTGNGPRRLKHEFSARHHERGILSMARGNDVDSASCQFFVMHGVNPGLDGKYSVFGKLIDGFDALDAIVTTPGAPIDSGTVRPSTPQRLTSALVVRVPEK